MLFTEAGTTIDEKYGKLPLIVAGDFNINFADEHSLPLLTFFKDKLNLIMNNNRMQSTTRGGTTIDAVFWRYINEIESKIYVSYFSYHKPIVTKIPL